MAKTATYIQRGETLDFRNSTETAIPAGTVVLFGDRMGVAGGEIAAGGSGALHVVGVFDIPKKTGVALEMGEAVVYTEENGIDKATDKAMGYAVSAATAEASTAIVKLLG